MAAKKEAVGDNVRASRFDRSFDAGNFGDEDEEGDGQDIRSGDSSLYGNILRSTVSREWSKNGRHSHRVQARAERKENTEAVREAHYRSKVPTAAAQQPTDGERQR